MRQSMLTQNAILPQKGSQFAAGFDLYSSENTVVSAKGKLLVKTGISMALPANTYGRVAPRSGLAVKSFITTGAGVIDEDYRGEVGVLLFNHSNEDFQIKHGDRIAQLIIEQIIHPQIVEVNELNDTQRGEGGFGSTGIATIVNHSHNNLQNPSEEVSGQENKENDLLQLGTSFSQLSQSKESVNASMDKQKQTSLSTQEPLSKDYKNAN